MISRVELTTDGPYWPAKPSGLFTLKSAYHQLVSDISSLDYSMHIWCLTLLLGGILFIWKLWMHSLPLDDNLRSWKNIYPTQCVFCRLHSDGQDHIFLFCPNIQPLWKEISIIFLGPMPCHSTIRTYLLRWWRTSSLHNMIGQLRAIVPSLVTWVIWKEYTLIKFGDISFSYRRMFE